MKIEIKIDEGSNAGPAKIRIRSLLAALKNGNGVKKRKEWQPDAHPPFLRKK